MENNYGVPTLTAGDIRSLIAGGLVNEMITRDYPDIIDRLSKTATQIIETLTDEQCRIIIRTVMEEQMVFHPDPNFRKHKMSELIELAKKENPKKELNKLIDLSAHAEQTADERGV